MIVTPATLQALQTGFRALYLQGFGSVASNYALVAMKVQSTAKLMNYGWMKDLPGMREWVGTRQVNNLESTNAQLINKDWEHTIGVKRTDIEDDELGLYSLMAQQQGEIVGRHPDELVWGLLPQGFTVKGMDGQPFFDADHIGYTAKGEEVSWSNVQAGAGAPWFLADLSRTYMKPLIFQERKKAEYTALNKNTDSNVFLENQYLYGADARYVAGFGFHQLCVGSSAALDADNFKAARMALETQRRPDGSPLPVRATHLIVGGANRSSAEELLNKANLAGGESNVLYKAVTLEVNQYLG